MTPLPSDLIACGTLVGVGVMTRRATP